MGGASRFLMLLTTPFPLLWSRPSALRLARHSRVSIACLSSHRRFFSSSVRPRLGFSVGASEQIQTQTGGIGEGFGDSIDFPTRSSFIEKWPEWRNLVENLRSGGYFDRGCHEDDAFAVFEDLPEEFVRAANACLAFARERPNLLRSLSVNDIEVVVDNGSAFLFKSGIDSTRQLRSFVAKNDNNGLESGADTVDVMRFLLTFAYDPFLNSDQNFKNKVLVEPSVRNLLNELVGLSRSTRESGFTESTPRQFSAVYGQHLSPLGRSVEMKRGDWICSKCSFMNFARNMNCLECNEDRPKRSLTGAEWECPQCDFFNYGRNYVCIRCDCKRPGEDPFGSTSSKLGTGFGQKREMMQPQSGSNSNLSEMERRLAANDEKAERWFSKVSQLDNVSDMSSAIADEDFPEIMPLRKGVNRFVVSTRKTPLERRLANAQYRRNLGNDGSPEGNVDGTVPNRTSETSINQSLDRILGRSTSASETEKTISDKKNDLITDGSNTTGTERFTSQYRRSLGNQGSDSGYKPFVPLPPDMFAKPPKSRTEEEFCNDAHSLPPKAREPASSSDEFGNNAHSLLPKAREPASSSDEFGNNAHSLLPKAREPSNSSDEFGNNAYSLLPKVREPAKFSDELLSQTKENQTDGKKIDDQTEKAERWFKKVQELDDEDDLASVISDEDFPEIMPMRKGENRFVVPKKKDRSLTSPQYKRRLAMEQANNSNFVPFVPFPPDYFAKKDKQPGTGDSASTPAVSSKSEQIPETQKKLEENNKDSPNWGTVVNPTPRYENQQSNRGSWTADSSVKRSDETHMGSFYGRAAGNSVQQSSSLSGTGSPAQQPESNLQRETGSSNRGFTGKSLEGSAVKEPDPLDMSEEAKAERWFRRVSQINDISELSKIPDEDFPSIMPMRKGVNRFVVSKRKTPLERRLTSPQYRRNLPIVSSDPGPLPPTGENGS